jgi:hypothetical protein
MAVADFDTAIDDEVGDDLLHLDFWTSAYQAIDD